MNYKWKLVGAVQFETEMNVKAAGREIMNTMCRYERNLMGPGGGDLVPNVFRWDDIPYPGIRSSE